MTRLGGPWHGIVKLLLSQPHNQTFIHLENWLQKHSSFVAQDLYQELLPRSPFMQDIKVNDGGVDHGAECDDSGSFISCRLWPHNLSTVASSFYSIFGSISFSFLSSHSIVLATILFPHSDSIINTPKMLYSFLSAASIFTQTVLSHGIITQPPVRAVGPAMTTACGASVAALVTADNTSHVEGMPEAAAQIASFNSTACNVFMCKGLQFADNTANIQTFQPGQVVNMLASIPIPHEGPMNVSVINTQTNTAIGKPLISFDSYADESLAVLPANNTNFNVTIPTTLGNACSVAGTCVSFLRLCDGVRN